MCYRFVLEQADRVAVELNPEEIIDYTPHPRYNIAVSQIIAVLYQSDRRRVLRGMRWGLIPHWAKDPVIGAKLANARSETAALKPAFRTPFRQHRCLIPADGFYEWQEVRPKVKQPYLIRRLDRRWFTFAGLYDCWKAPNGQELWTVTLLTTVPNKLIAPLHDRMPVIITAERHRNWLDLETPPVELSSLLTPASADEWIATPVSRHVNHVGRDDPQCIAPLAEP